MATKTVDKKKLSAEAKKLLADAIAATVASIKVAGEEITLRKQVKTSRAKVIALIKKKPFDAAKVKAATATHNALVKKTDQKIVAINKACLAKLEPEAKKIETFLKNNKAALNKAGQTQLGALAKKLKYRLSQTKLYIGGLK